MRYWVKKCTAVRVKNNKTAETKEIPSTDFFVAIGHQPNSEIFKGFIDMDEAVILKQYRNFQNKLEGVLLPEMCRINYRQP